MYPSNNQFAKLFSIIAFENCDWFFELKEIQGVQCETVKENLKTLVLQLSVGKERNWLKTKTVHVVLFCHSIGVL